MAEIRVTDPITKGSTLLDENMTVAEARQALTNVGTYQNIDAMLEEFIALGGGGGGTGAGAARGIPTTDPRLASSFAQYMQARGISGGVGGTAAERFIERQAPDVRNIFDMNQRILAARAFDAGSTMMPVPQDYSSFARDFNLAQGGLGETALTTLRAMSPLTTAARAVNELGYARGYDADTGEIAEATGDMAELQRLMRRGLSQGYGGIGARYIARSLPQLLQRYETSRLEGKVGLPSSFVGYLEKKYGFGKPEDEDNYPYDR